jgi:hypothetical protein
MNSCSALQSSSASSLSYSRIQKSQAFRISLNRLDKRELTPLVHHTKKEEVGRPLIFRPVPSHPLPLKRATQQHKGHKDHDSWLRPTRAVFFDFDLALEINEA